LTIADKLAKEQRSISVAEFFEKNKHLLGFDSPTRGIITTIKEAVDNSLDACEEAEFLPDIYISIKRITNELFKVAIEDNGPGIVPEQVPFVFGKLLYGSRFHQIRQTRGQQGIGISAAVLYAQLTTGRPSSVISRVSSDNPAYKFLIQIAIEVNEPDVVLKEEFIWDRTHGTRVELEFKGSLTAKKRLLDYLRYTSIVNPHTRIMAEIEDEIYSFERVSDEPVKCALSIKPHPHGIEFGQLKRIIKYSNLNARDFLIESFSRVGQKTADEILTLSKIHPDTTANSLSHEQVNQLLLAMQQVKVPAPPTSQCLSPIGEELIRKGLEKEIELDFISSRTRPPAVSGGHPFVVEAAIGYGGKLPSEGTAQILRFANRVPLLYQQGACSITQAIADINWKSYSVSQQGLPVGPLLVLVHLASTNVPFTSESKDAVASIPEIEREITLALQDLGRDLKHFLSRRDKNRLTEDRARALCSIIPLIAGKVGEIVNLPVPDIALIEGRIMKKLVVRRKTDNSKVIIEAVNYTEKPIDISLYEISHDPAVDIKPVPDFVQEMNGEFTRVYTLHLEPHANWIMEYTGQSRGVIEVRGIAEEKKVVIDLDV